MLECTYHGSHQGEEKALYDINTLRIDGKLRQVWTCKKTQRASYQGSSGCIIDKNCEEQGELCKSVESIRVQDEPYNPITNR